jgi:carboxyl-terminal processing protease
MTHFYGYHQGGKFKSIGACIGIFLLILSVSACWEDNDTPTGWIRSFDDLITVLSKKYAFTDHKSIDWYALKYEFRDRIAAAYRQSDVRAYYLALREFAYSIPDGHIQLSAATGEAQVVVEELKLEQVGGGYGFGIIGLDDGRVMVHFVTDAGQAREAGIESKAEILKWDGESIQDALEKTSVLWAGNVPATDEGKRLAQYRLLVRDPVGTQRQVTYKNLNEAVESSALLTAVDDDYETLTRTDLSPDSDELQEFVQHEILDNGYGYLKVTVIWSRDITGNEKDADDYARLQTYRDFQSAVQTFVDHDVPGVIMDLRHNLGGEDILAALLSGFFYYESQHYESVTFYDEVTDQFELAETLNVNPQVPYYSGPVRIMVSPGNISSGEGVAMAVQKMPQARVVSFFGSQGSFGIIIDDSTVELENGFRFNYPVGRSLDEKGEIQLDSDADGYGGVMPDERVPLTIDTMNSVLLNRNSSADPELEYAIENLQSRLVPVRGTSSLLPTSPQGNPINDPAIS